MIFLFFLRGEDEYILSAYSDRFKVSVKEFNITPSVANPNRILSRVEPLNSKGGFKILLNLPKEKLIHYSIDRHRVKYLYNDKNSANIPEKTALENLEIIIDVGGGVIGEVLERNLFEAHTSKTEVIILCTDLLPPHNDSYTVNKVYRH